MRIENYTRLCGWSREASRLNVGAGNLDETLVPAVHIDLGPTRLFRPIRRSLLVELAEVRGIPLGQLQ